MTKQNKICFICGENFSTYYNSSRFCNRKCYIKYWKENIMDKAQKMSREVRHCTGYKVLRFTDMEILRNPNSVMMKLSNNI